MMRFVEVSFLVETLVLEAATCATRSEMGLAKSSVLEFVGVALPISNTAPKILKLTALIFFKGPLLVLKGAPSKHSSRVPKCLRG